MELQTPSTQIVTLFGNRIFIEVRGKTKSLGWVLIQYQYVLTERGNLNVEPDTEGRQYEVTQGECHVKTEDWNDTPTSQRTPEYRQITRS